ncbi:MAG TPA: hypothetical protein VGU44_04260 [Gammaproteobacteria bacterium]|nr:hypothetical protein [Gammaproteobacteria bacterium]
MTELSNLLVKNVIHTNQVGYTSLFEKDFMAFPNRINHDVNAHTFQISTGKEILSGEKWNAHQDKSIEQVAYYSPKDQKDASKVIAKVEFEGWRRYVAERRPTEGGRIIFHVRGLQKQSALARVIDDQSFREIGWMEPIVAVTEDPILAINFRETAIEDNPDYIDDLFSRINRVEMLPHEIMIDLKNVIALNSIDRFKKRMIESGFSEYEFEEALKLIRPTALKGVASPFYVAALFCRTKGKFKEARKLLKKIAKTHWQYTEAIDLERSLYEQEIRENKQKYERVIQELKTEVVHLRSRGSIADHASTVESSLQFKDTATAQQDFTIKIQQKAETLKKTNAQHTQRLTETLAPLAKETIPYFQGLQGLLSKRHDQQQTTQPENTPKTRKRQRVT